MVDFRLLLLVLIPSCCFLYSSRRFFAYDADISALNLSLSFDVGPPSLRLPRYLLLTSDRSERSEPYHGTRRTDLETFGNAYPAPPIHTKSTLPAGPASGPMPTPVSKPHPPPTPPYLTRNQTAELDRIKNSLRSAGTQNTTLRLLFDSSTVGMMLATLPGATLLAPQDSAWLNLANQEGGAEVQQLLNGPNGFHILHSLLLSHVLRQYLLYVDFQVRHPSFVHCLPTRSE